MDEIIAEISTNNSTRDHLVPYRIKPGESLNPAGRPKVPDEVKKMLKAATPDAVRLLVDTIRNDKAKLDLRIKCGEIVLDRVYGKATQPIEGNIDNHITVQMLGVIADYSE